MMNPVYHFRKMRELLDEFEPSRERSLAATKLDECEMWLARCEPTTEALQRDQAAPLARPTTDGGTAVMLADEIKFTPAGYQGPAQHTHTTACDGFHGIEHGPGAQQPVQQQPVQQQTPAQQLQPQNI
jgi:hypothetical protein